MLLFRRNVSRAANASFANYSALSRSQRYSTTTTTTASSSTAGRGNFFAFLGLPLSPVVNLSQLQKNYHQIQLLAHPDKQQQQQVDGAAASDDAASGVVASSSPPQFTADDSTYANAAYETLRHPFRRNRYLLKHWVLRARKQLLLLDAAPSPSTPLPTLPELNRVEEESIALLDDSKENHGYDLPLLPPSPAGATRTKALPQSFMFSMMDLTEAVFSPETPHEKLLQMETELKQQAMGFEEDAKKAWDAQDLEAFRVVIMHWVYVDNLLCHIHERK